MLALTASIGWPVLDRIRFGDSFAISPHGLFIAIGFMIGASLLARMAVRRGIDDDHIQSIIFWCLVGAIIGSRFFYVLAHFSEFDNLGQMLAIWRGGISLLGGIAGAVLINVHRLRRYGYRFFQVADPGAVAVALGISIGRTGDLIIGDHLGRPTSWVLAWKYSGGTLAPPFTCAAEVCTAALQGERISRDGATLLDAGNAILAQGVGVHQTALYDMILVALLFGLLWFLQTRPRREGVLTLTFGLFYGCFRLLEDSLRIDKRFGPLTGSQWTALTVAVISAAILLWWRFHPLAPDARADPVDRPRDEDDEPELEPLT
ncbi:MAG: prolipoprotein diacylglyceryl transferase family protein [Actinomycetota bacterium]